jgi:hypothetical protein
MANLRRPGPNMNTGEPCWDMSDADLRLFLDQGKPVSHKAVADAAEFLCRNGTEIRNRLRELGYIKRTQ